MYFVINQRVNDRGNAKRLAAGYSICKETWSERKETVEEDDQENEDILRDDVSVPLPYQAQVADLQLYSSVKGYMTYVLCG